jgi:hypothetical protein
MVVVGKIQKKELWDYEGIVLNCPMAFLDFFAWGQQSTIIFLGPEGRLRCAQAGLSCSVLLMG